MYSRKNLGKTKTGFTLLELMIVVSILGILSSIAIPAFIRYIQRAKTSEARSNLQKIYAGAVVYYNSEHVKRGFDANTLLSHRFPCDSSPTGSLWCPETVPAGTKTSQPKECWLNNEPDEGQIWKALDFFIGDHNYYAYRYVCTEFNSMSAFQGQAAADLDGDGITSFYERAGYAEESTGSGVGAAGIYEHNPLE